MVVVFDFTCGTCFKAFPAGWKARDNHCAATGHRLPAFECDTCPRYFGSDNARAQHMDACGHWQQTHTHDPEWVCRQCDWAFSSADDREEHEQDDHGFYFCDGCDLEFNYRISWMNHMDDWHGCGSAYSSAESSPYASDGEEWPCRVCDELWCTEEDMIEHEREDHDYYFCEACDLELDSYNWPYHEDCDRWEASQNQMPAFYCDDCDRAFDSHSNLQQHLRSRAHIGQPFSCPCCGCDFTTATGLAHHIERGACPDLPDRAFQKDFADCVAEDLLEYDSSYLNPKHYNGYEWACATCDREFRDEHALDQHLASSVHKRTHYTCPNFVECPKKFTTIAAAINHLESESCGYFNFDHVQSIMENVMRDDRLCVY